MAESAVAMRCFTHCAMSIRFHPRALRSSCGCALRILGAPMPNNILVIGSSDAKQGQLRQPVRRNDSGAEYRARVKIAAFSPRGLYVFRDSPDTVVVRVLVAERALRRACAYDAASRRDNVISATVCSPGPAYRRWTWTHDSPG